MSTILLIDDDPDLLTLLSMILKKEGYQVEVAEDGESGLEMAIQLQPDLILLDIMMPGVDGWEACREIRKITTAPIIYLTAKREESDIVRGLQLGADDFIPKPFRRHELTARIEAVLRRSRLDTPDEDVVYEIGDLVIDQVRWEVRRGEEAVHLTPTEFNLLLMFARNADRPISHREILTTVWGENHESNLNLLKVYIRQLRRKIEDDPDRPQRILTQRGIGYRLAS
ncbi:MAG: response regulator [Ardenticatenales bacterium]|nr:response regulator [Ardenticatenales bacterium]